MKDEVIYDAYQTTFRSINEMNLFIEELYRTGSWERTPVDQLEFFPVPSDIGELSIMAMASGLSPQIMQDTRKNTGLVVKSAGGYIPVRSSAIKSILDRVKVNGTALSKLDKTTLAQFLNECAKVAGGDALIRKVASKISAIHGGDSKDYQILGMDVIFQTTDEELRRRFDGVKFSTGYFNHNKAGCTWEVKFRENSENEEQDKKIRLYERELLKLNIQTREFVPLIDVETSDTGCCGANIRMRFFIPGSREALRFCDPIGLHHRSDADIKQFKENVGMIYSKVADSFHTMEEMAKIPLSYPCNALLGIMRKLKIPKQYGAEVFESSKSYLPPGSSVYEAYSLMGEVITMVRQKAKNVAVTLKYEEIIARAPKLDWTEHDVPGEYAY